METAATGDRGSLREQVLPATPIEEVIDVIQLSTYDALSGRMADDAARAARRRLARGGRGADRRTLLATLRGTPRRRPAQLRRAA